MAFIIIRFLVYVTHLWNLGWGVLEYKRERREGGIDREIEKTVKIIVVGRNEEESVELDL